jgi:cytochrome c biogenesis protein CcmG/thiol:disulfide interchange protein DsbE
VKRWLAFAPLAALALLAVLFVGWTLRRDPDVKPDALIGRPLPASEVVLRDGRAVRLDEAARGPAVINVFASWCAPCRVEHPELIRMGGSGVTVIGLSYKDDPADTEAFLLELGDPFETVFFDRSGRAGLDLGISGVPETFVVDGRGVVVAKHAGPMTPQDADRIARAWRDAAR